MNTIDIYTVLAQPRAVLLDVRRIDERIEETRGRYLTKSPTLSDMPKGGSRRRDLGDLVCDLEPLVIARRHAEESYIAAYVRAERVIDAVPGERSRECMRGYYLHGEPQTRIAARLDISRSAVCHAIRRGVARIAED